MSETRTSRPDPRASARAAFLAAAGHGAASLDGLPVDASFRRYFRLVGSAPPMLLMDAPPPREDVRPFIRMARHLTGHGLSAPRIYDHDAAQGFALIEDFGEGTYSRLIDAGADPEPLFAAAIDVLAHLHSTPETARIAAPPYDTARLLNEVSELPDWYGPAQTGGPLSPDARDRFIDLWREALAALPAPENGLVLLDYHPDNLMRLDGRPGLAACGVLDFQDALIGPAAYDMASLLQDARVDVPEPLEMALLGQYVRARHRDDPEFDTGGFTLLYATLAAQRATKILGIFARLDQRDGKPQYLRHMPRLWRYLQRSLAHPALAALKAWYATNVPAPDGL
jgi:aminoglycoside/choline kinase family phosphotransferase